MTTRHSHPDRRGGFATITMLSCTALVGLAVVSIGALFSLEARHTHQVQDESQLRQLLLAGGAAARQMAADPSATPEAPHSLALPSALSGRNASLRLTLLPGPDPARRTIQVTATWGLRAASQTVTFTRRGSGWQATSTQLTRAF